MVFLTGDTHGEFGRIEEFCAECGTSTDDVMVILGDAGINFYRDKRDDELKEYLSELPVTLLCIQGNHEERPDEILGYEEMEWHGGIVLFQPDYPNILFAWDGEVYDFDGKKGDCCRRCLFGGQVLQAGKRSAVVSDGAAGCRHQETGRGKARTPWVASGLCVFAHGSTPRSSATYLSVEYRPKYRGLLYRRVASGN